MPAVGEHPKSDVWRKIVRHQAPMMSVFTGPGRVNKYSVGVQDEKPGGYLGGLYFYSLPVPKKNSQLLCTICQYIYIYISVISVLFLNSLQSEEKSYCLCVGTIITNRIIKKVRGGGNFLFFGVFKLSNATSLRELYLIIWSFYSYYTFLIP